MDLEKLKELINNAENGNVEAQYNLGYYYEKNERFSELVQFWLKIPLEKSESVKWYKLAAKSGHNEALYRLGKIIALNTALKTALPIKATGDDEVYKEPIHYFNQAAEHGHIKSQYELGRIFKYYLSRVGNYPGNIEEMNPASETFYDNAYYDTRITDKWRDEACKWLLLAADNGDIDAQFDLAEAFADGELFERDYVEASRRFHIVETAAESGDDIRLQFRIGKAYKLGEGTQKNIPLAVKWFTKAALGGHINAQFELGNIYKRGTGIKKDLVEAYAYFSLVAIINSDGKIMRDRLEKKLTPDQTEAGINRLKALQKEIDTRITAKQEKK